MQMSQGLTENGVGTDKREELMMTQIREEGTWEGWFWKTGDLFAGARAWAAHSQ